MSKKNALSDILDWQIKELVQNAPDLVTTGAVKVIAPILKNIALQQKYPKYFIHQSPAKSLVLTTLSKTNSQLENPLKNVIYLYPTLAIAQQDSPTDLEDTTIQEVEIIPLLFQFLGIVEIDSLIIIDGSPQEIDRQKLYNLCQTQLKTQSKTEPNCHPIA
jgi:hypothetical protein